MLSKLKVKKIQITWKLSKKLPPKLFKMCYNCSTNQSHMFIGQPLILSVQILLNWFWKNFSVLCLKHSCFLGHVSADPYDGLASAPDSLVPRLCPSRYIAPAPPKNPYEATESVYMPIYTADDYFMSV